MIISDNAKLEKIKFQSLISRMDKLLNDDVAAHEDYYIKRGGKLLEQDVFGAIQECAKGTEFQGSIQLVSGASFPDIVANNYFGIEVKSTEKIIGHQSAVVFWSPREFKTSKKYI